MITIDRYIFNPVRMSRLFFVNSYARFWPISANHKNDFNINSECLSIRNRGLLILITPEHPSGRPRGAERNSNARR